MAVIRAMSLIQYRETPYVIQYRETPYVDMGRAPLYGYGSTDNITNDWQFKTITTFRQTPLMSVTFRVLALRNYPFF